MSNMHSLFFLSISLAIATALPARAVIVESQSNYVANGAITVAPGNNDRSDWASVPAYQSDTSGDAPAIDFTSLQIAHDDTNVYVRMLLNTQSSPEFFGFKHNLYLDTDLDRSTGFFGSGGFLSLGADVLIQGASYFTFAGGASQGAFSWNFEGGVTYDDFPTTDIELSISRAAIGNPDAFDIILNASSQSPEDYYPDVATGGATGGSFRYSLVAIPEPSPALCFLIIGGCMMWHKQRVRS